MRLGIMQPYFMPYLGYISLIKHTDRFILFDTVQFIRHGWIERNRILKPNEGWQYIQVPIIKCNGRDTLIKDVLINNKENWKAKILAQLFHYKKRAPYYNEVVDLLSDILSAEYFDIAHLNKASLVNVCRYLGIDKQIDIYSEMNLQIEAATAPDEWALNICKSIPDADEYWNPVGGLEFFERSKYEDAGISIGFQKMNLAVYDQRRNSFESGLSIIDVMMFCSVSQINDMLDSFEIL